MESLINIANEYLLLRNRVASLIGSYGLSNKYLSEKLAIDKRTVANKIKKANWSVLQMIELAKLIDEAIMQDKADVEMMRKSENRNFISSKEFEKQMCWI
jgi:hypothetical protein